MTSENSVFFPDINLTRLKRHVRDYFLPTFKDLPLERIVLHEYSTNGKEYLLMFEIDHNESVLLANAFKKIQSLEGKDISKMYPEDIPALYDKYKEEPEVAILKKIWRLQEEPGFCLTFAKEDEDEISVKASVKSMRDYWNLRTAFKNVYRKDSGPTDYLREWDFFIKMKDGPIPEGIVSGAPSEVLFKNEGDKPYISHLEPDMDEGDRLDENLRTGFSHSPDYRSVTKDGKNYSLTTNQAAIVECLHEAFKNGTPEVSQDYIFDRIGSSASNPRLRDTFKSDLGVKEALIATGKRKGLIRLNM